MADFLQISEAQLIAFAQNFAGKLSSHEPDLDTIDAADVTQATTNATTLEQAIVTVNSIREDAQEYTDVKDALLYGDLGAPLPTAPTATDWPAFGVGAISGLIAWYRQIANRIKADPGYTPGMGEDLGIVGTTSAPGTTPPTITATALPGYNVEVGWSRQGHDGIRLRMQRGAETEWTDLGVDMNPPYTNNTPPLVAGQPEERRIQAAYVDNDATTTDWSATVTVVAHS